MIKSLNFVIWRKLKSIYPKKRLFTKWLFIDVVIKEIIRCDNGKFKQTSFSANTFAWRKYLSPVLSQTTNQLYIRNVARNVSCHHRCLNQLASCPVHRLKQRGQKIYEVIKPFNNNSSKKISESTEVYCPCVCYTRLFFDKCS